MPIHLNTADTPRPLNASQRKAAIAALNRGASAAEIAQDVAAAGHIARTAAPSAAPKSQTITQFAASVLQVGTRSAGQINAMARGVWTARRAK